MFFLVFHQGGGARACYLCTGCVRATSLLGSDGNRAVPRGVQRLVLPVERAGRWRRPRPGRARPIPATTRGPIRRSPKAWCSIGDAAGHNDPIIGQGLSIALRDARIVRDLDARRRARRRPRSRRTARSVSARMERLRFIADILAVAQAEDADNRSARRAMLAEKMAADGSSARSRSCRRVRRTRDHSERAARPRNPRTHALCLTPPRTPPLDGAIRRAV